MQDSLGIFKSTENFLKFKVVTITDQTRLFRCTGPVTLPVLQSTSLQLATYSRPAADFFAAMRLPAT